MSSTRTDPTSLPPRGAASSWATGLTFFATGVLLVSGAFQVIQGIVAVLDDEFFVRTPSYTFDFDVTAWGVVHIVVGAVMIVASLALSLGALWARVVAVVLVIVSLIANFVWLPFYPLWSLVIIALDLAVLWGIGRYEPDA